MKRAKYYESQGSTATAVSRRSGRKRAYGRKRERPFNSVVRANARFPALGFPNRLTMKHRYVDNISLVSTAAALAVHNFSANGMYDPDITGTGHQPMYFDNCTGIYDHYTVIGSIIRVTFCRASTTEHGSLVGIMINDDTTVTPTSAVAIAEQSRTKCAMTQLAGADTRGVTIVQKWSAKGTFGGSILGNDNLQGTSGANPTEQTYFTLFAQCQVEANTATFEILVEIEYIAVWDELKDLAQQ